MYNGEKSSDWKQLQFNVLCMFYVFYKSEKTCFFVFFFICKSMFLTSMNHRLWCLLNKKTRRSVFDRTSQIVFSVFSTRGSFSWSCKTLLMNVLLKENRTVHDRAKSPPQKCLYSMGQKSKLLYFFTIFLPVNCVKNLILSGMYATYYVATLPCKI